MAYPNSCLAYPNEILPNVHHSCWPTQNLLGPFTGLPKWKFLEPPMRSSRLRFSDKRNFYYSGPGRVLCTIIMVKFWKTQNRTRGVTRWVLRVKPNFLQCYHLSRTQIFGFIHNAISALSQLFNFLKIIHKPSNTSTSKALRSPLFVDSRLFYIPKNVDLII